MIPNYEIDVKRLAELHPEAFRNAHTGNPHTEDFVRIVATHFHALDQAVGLNGKRGNPHDISDDALNILDPVDGPGRTPDGRRCWVVDFIVGAGGSNPSVTWNAFRDPVASSGAWVKPTMLRAAVPQHIHPGREEMMKAGEWLDAFYRSDDGLRRSLTKDGAPDWEGIGAWLFDVYFLTRVNGASVEDAKASVVAAIQQTHEWRSKHP